MKAVAIVGIALLVLEGALGAQDPLREAKDLYASAAYEDALSTFTKLSGAAADTPDVRRQAEEYRAFCLFALGRTGEAESVAEAIFKKDPFAQLDAGDASPRLEAMFASVRKRLLPSLIREHFRMARSQLDVKDYRAAEPQLVQARLMITDAEKLGVRDDALADLGVLVDGFLQMTRLASNQQNASSTAAGSSLTAAGSSSLTAAGSDVAATAPLPRAGAATRTPAAPPRAYSAADEGVTPPIVIDQRMPAMSAVMARIAQSSHKNGILDVVINETGDVVDAIVRQPLMPAYDGIVVSSARRWKYRPAMKDGVPVRYVKTIALVVP
jgi:tetratricopeptide (TPR) repeat protein